MNKPHCDLTNDVTAIIFLSDGREITKDCFSYAQGQVFLELRAVHLIDGEYQIVIDHFKLDSIEGYRIQQHRNTVGRRKM